ncbi:MAG: DUF2306 domain-containing protein [Hyphomonadaceae bacterium]
MEQVKRQPKWPGWLVQAAAFAVMAVALSPIAPDLTAGFGDARPHAPNFALWGRLGPQVQIHIIAALAALVIGCVILALPKGRGPHRVLGWAWVAAMGITAVSSLFITGLSGNSYSLIHLLTGWTIIALPMGIVAIRNRRLEWHKRAMTGMFVGGLLVAGLLTFLPGRFMFQLFFG